MSLLNNSFLEQIKAANTQQQGLQDAVLQALKDFPEAAHKVGLTLQTYQTGIVSGNSVRTASYSGWELLRNTKTMEPNHLLYVMQEDGTIFEVMRVAPNPHGISYIGYDLRKPEWLRNLIMGVFNMNAMQVFVKALRGTPYSLPCPAGIFVNNSTNIQQDVTTVQQTNILIENDEDSGAGWQPIGGNGRRNPF